MKEGSLECIFSLLGVVDISKIDKIEPLRGDRDPVLDEQYALHLFGRNVPSGLVTLSQENNGDTRISPGQHYSVHDYLWYGIITKNGTSVCRVVYVSYRGKYGI
ncbi:hypothetical protein MTR67_039227 [Solanum verrucosum]|uniref:Uncharacterized protein n=1 Tax=Solanum verrucosum TaxID=315347 RepID=A0AAF0ZNF4_SOLVR|nr:hypothetical protein MTR67_039227 [Solanum verrucosum]